VYRSVYGTAFFRLAGTTTTPGFVDLGLAPGNAYTYQVLAFDAAGNSSMPTSVTLRTPVPRVTVLSPDGGERWSRDSRRTITWLAIGYTRVNLDFTADNGVTWTSIATNLDASTGRYDWTVPGALTTWARVRIRDVDAKSSDVSTGPFSITAPPPRVVLNEILANEPGSATSGEFVELVNTESTSVDISGWVLMDATAARHTFPANTVLGAGKALVVFSGSGGIPPGTPNAVAASTGTLSLNNGGDTVTLLTEKAETVNAYTYSATQASKDGVSINRDPDATSTGSFVFHTALSTLGASPGTRVDGTAF
jgi:lamin tail-like protein